MRSRCTVCNFQRCIFFVRHPQHSQHHIGDRAPEQVDRACLTLPRAGLRQIALTCLGVAQVNPALEDAEYKNANGNNQVNPGKADMADHTPATTGANKV